MTIKQLLEEIRAKDKDLYGNVMRFKDNYKYWRDNRVEERAQRGYILGYLEALVKYGIISMADRKKLFVYITL